MSSIIFHIDVNSAYLSWTAVEKLKNGSEIDLRKIPSIIGGKSSIQTWGCSGKINPCKKVWSENRGTSSKRAQKVCDTGN